MEDFINLTLAVPSAVTNTVSPVHYLEANAIRYVAGYVVRAVKKVYKIGTPTEGGNHPLLVRYGGRYW